MEFLYIIIALAAFGYYIYLTVTSLNRNIFKDRREYFTIIFIFFLFGSVFGGAELFNNQYLQIACVIASTALGVFILRKIKNTESTKS